MHFAEIGLLNQGQGRQERIEIVTAEGRQAEKFAESPEGSQGDEEQPDGPEVIEVLQMPPVT